MSVKVDIALVWRLFFLTKSKIQQFARYLVNNVDVLKDTFCEKKTRKQKLRPFKCISAVSSLLMYPR